MAVKTNSNNKCELENPELLAFSLGFNFVLVPIVFQLYRVTVFNVNKINYWQVGLES